MTDMERERINAICEVAGIKEIDDLSDGFHTFRQLYYQRMMLFAALVKQNKNRAWKSLRHEDGELCFGGGWFIVGIDTPEGSYTYHYENKYFGLFDCEILVCSKHWDGHTEKDVTRLLSLPTAQPELDSEALVRTIEMGITATNLNDVYSLGMRNGMRWCKSLIDGVEPKFEDYVTSVDDWKALPSAQPGRKIGRWLLNGERYGVQYYRCSECEEEEEGFNCTDMKYCPNCGADMRGKRL